MPADQFLSLAIRHKCCTTQLRNTLRKHAVRKNGSREDARNSNLLFPPSMIQIHLPFESVQKIVNCSCDVCRPVIVSEPFNDTRLINEIKDEPGSRIMIAILAHMGASFATRLLHFHGLGRGNDFDVRAVFDRNPNLKSTLFQSLSGLPRSRHAPSVDDLATTFCRTFAETKQLFIPPSFQEGEVFREIPSNSHLPFVNETDLSGRNWSSARLYTFQIHKEFCSSDLSVCFHLNIVSLSDANKAACDRNQLCSVKSFQFQALKVTANETYWSIYDRRSIQIW